MSKMRERIARAIDPERWAAIDGMPETDMARGILATAELLRVAAVLSAMREPTEEMIERGAEIHYGNDDMSAANFDEQAEEIWQAMIDSA